MKSWKANDQILNILSAKSTPNLIDCKDVIEIDLFQFHAHDSSIDISCTTEWVNEWLCKQTTECMCKSRDTESRHSVESDIVLPLNIMYGKISVFPLFRCIGSILKTRFALIHSLYTWKKVGAHWCCCSCWFYTAETRVQVQVQRMCVCVCLHILCE